MRLTACGPPSTEGPLTTQCAVHGGSDRERSLPGPRLCGSRLNRSLTLHFPALLPPRPPGPLPPAQVLRVEGHTRPCLGLMFAPWDPRLLIYNEETKHVFARECGQGGPTDQSAGEGERAGRAGVERAAGRGGAGGAESPS